MTTNVFLLIILLFLVICIVCSIMSKWADDYRLERLMEAKKEYIKLGQWAPLSNYAHSAMQETLDRFGLGEK